ncbi:MAG: ATP-binding protein [Spirochaetales bacterium]
MRRKIIGALRQWKDSPQRKPLVLQGARQVGKTFSLREFGQLEFANTVHVNLEAQQAVAQAFLETVEPRRLLPVLEAASGQRIEAGKTLIILDEIQAAPRALTALKYFREIAPEYHIAAAGSLLGVAIHRESVSFPVGNVTTLNLNPFDFEEFLWAMGQDDLALAIRAGYHNREPLNAVWHEEAVIWYRKYLICGGLPAVVDQLRQSGSLIEIPTLQNQILNDYVADMAKYTSASESVKVRAAYQSIPVQLAKENRKFQYKVVQRGGSAALLGAALEWLGSAGIVLKCQKVQPPLYPLATHADLASFKLYLADTGLLTMRSGIAPQTLLSPMASDQSFLGALTENYVAQALTAAGHPLSYWESEGQAEVDFLVTVGSDVIPIEVKASTHTRSRSLHRFGQLYPPPYSIRLSTRNFGFENGIFSVPLYAVFCLAALR